MKLQAPSDAQAQVEVPVSGQQEPADTPAQPAAELTAPNLHGLELREARERWRAQGIVIIEDSQRVDNTVEAGTILSQSPDGGAPLQTKEIRVVVAAAPEMVTVPGVLGKDVAEATEELVAAGFEVPAPTKESAKGKLGAVLRQEPNAGSKSEKGSLVRLVIAGEAPAEGSEGEAQPEVVEVPKLRGMPLPRARKQLESAGLTVGSVREREDEELSSQRVLSQEPDGGSEVAKGSSVDLVVVAPD
nr:PASTA domain-containing protein [Pseudenhygromyxa sp. WMMC2535]